MAGAGVMSQSLKLALLVVVSSCWLIELNEGAHSTVTSGLVTFWQHELPTVTMPSSLQQLASPLSPSATNLFLNRLRKGTLQSSSKQFCASAKLYCSEKVFGVEPRVCIPPFFNYEYGELPCEFGAEEVSRIADSGIFFTEKDLILGKTVAYPDTSNKLHGRSFLPQELADALPFSSKKLPELLNIFSVSKGSNMELDMENTLAHCSYPSKAEVKECQTSGESMVSFISKNMGKDVMVITPAAGSKQIAKVQDVNLISTAGEKVTSCHDMMFPYLVYSCHITETTRVYDIALRSEDGKTFHGVSVCHLDTSSWNPSHIAFQVLKSEPGKGQVCHWIPENTVVWVPSKSM